MEAAAFAVRQNLETMREAGATIACLRSSGGGAGGALWPRIVSDVTGLEQDVREGPSRAGVGAALLAAICVGAATLQTIWPQPTLRVEPDPETAILVRRARTGGSASSRRPRARTSHALAAWQQDRSHGTMSPATGRDAEKPSGRDRGESS